MGGYDLERYAKKGESITWLSLASNKYYWTVNTEE